MKILNTKSVAKPKYESQSFDPDLTKKSFRINRSFLKKTMQNSTLLTNLRKEGETTKKGNTMNFTKQDSLGSAYEFKLQGLYEETVQLSNKIRKVSKEEKNMVLYKNELREAENEIYRTVRNKLYEKNFLH